MKTEQLKTSLFGYQKFSVCQYITALEEEFSAKLLAKDEECRALLEQERRRVEQLEGELSALRQAYEAQQREQQLISNTLMEAQRYAEQLKAQTQEQEQQARQRLEEALAQREKDLKEYDARIQQLRGLFGSMLQEMDAQAQQAAAEVEDVRAAAPERNMSLFRRKPELVV